MKLTLSRKVNCKDCLLQNKYPSQGLANNQFKTSLKPTAIGIYFMTNQQKNEAKRQSVELDDHIKRLREQIQNTRSKITQTKYLYQQSHNKNKSTIQTTINQAAIRSLNKQQYSISPTYFEPIPPFLLNKMLPISKQHKNHHLSLHSIGHQQDRYQEKYGHKNTISIYSKHESTKKNKKQNKKQNIIDFPKKPITSTPQKRPFSSNLQNKIIKKDKKFHKNKSSKSQNKINFKQASK